MARGAPASYMPGTKHGGRVDRDQMLKERARLQAALDGYNQKEAAVGRHVGLMARIANLDDRIANAANA